MRVKTRQKCLFLRESFVFVGNEKDPELQKAAQLWRFTPKAWTDFVNNPDPVSIRDGATAKVPLEEVYNRWTVSEDPQDHANSIKALFDGGVAQIYIHSGQADQKKVIDFYGKQVLPLVRKSMSAQAGVGIGEKEEHSIMHFNSSREMVPISLLAVAFALMLTMQTHSVPAQGATPESTAAVSAASTLGSTLSATTAATLISPTTSLTADATIVATLSSTLSLTSAATTSSTVSATLGTTVTTAAATVTTAATVAMTAPPCNHHESDGQCHGTNWNTCGGTCHN